MPRPEVRTSPDEAGPVPKDTHHAGYKSLDADLILEQTADIAGRTFDAAHTINALDLLFGDCHSGLFSISYLSSGGMRSEAFQWLRFAAAQAAHWDTQYQPQGIYMRCTMLPPEGVTGGRGGADHAHMMPFLWADLDYGTVGHKAPPNGLPLPPDEDAARKVLVALPTPSVLIHSGGGLYPIWMFERPVLVTDENREEVKARSQQWQQMIQATSEDLGWHYGSGVGDLARVLRLPGSINRKAGLERPCQIIEVTGEVYPQ
jgi:putative DNA primase/helicase